MPEKPSVVIGRGEKILGQNGTKPSVSPPDSISEVGDASAEELRLYLAKNLDDILLKALCKEPKRRYASAAQFVEDIHRHLGNQSVAASELPFKHYDLNFIRRNKAMVVGASVLMLLLVVIGMWQAQFPKKNMEAPIFVIGPVDKQPESGIKQSNPSHTQPIDQTDSKGGNKIDSPKAKETNPPPSRQSVINRSKSTPATSISNDQDNGSNIPHITNRFIIQVIDANDEKKPIDGASVEFSPSYGDAVSKVTDSDGKAFFQIDKSITPIDKRITAKVTVSRHDYKEKTQENVALFPNEPRTVRLTPKTLSSKEGEKP